MELDDFNVLIGPNAAGKSNFLQILRFVRDVYNWGLDNAISLEGGITFLRNVKLGASQPTMIEITADARNQILSQVAGERYVAQNDAQVLFRAREMVYRLAVKSRSRGRSFEVGEDTLRVSADIFTKSESKEGPTERSLGEGSILITKSRNKINSNIEIKAGTEPITKVRNQPHIEPRIKPKSVLLEAPYAYFNGSLLSQLAQDITVLDFDPKMSKRATAIVGKVDLEEDGSNLSIVLKNIVEDKKKRQELIQLVSDLLRFVKEIDVEKFADRSLLFKLKESYSEKHVIPASLISEGSINVSALVVALYFMQHSFVAIEEPERNLHPFLISKVVEMIQDVSRKKQVLATTHSVELVRKVDPRKILIVERDQDGYSNVMRPEEKETVKGFLENGMGIDELYAQNFFEET